MYDRNHNVTTNKADCHKSVIIASRKRRIAKGSGMEVQDINQLIQQMLQMKKMMKSMHKMGGKGLPKIPGMG
ncbi:MAG: hypothetical protein WD077_10855 [Bacteroidia bacterium]